MIYQIFKFSTAGLLLLLSACSPTKQGTEFHVSNVFIENSSVQGFLDLESISISPFSTKIVEAFPDRGKKVFKNLTGPTKHFVEESGIQPEDFAQIAVMMDDLGSIDFKSETLLSNARFAFACKINREVPLELITKHLIAGVQGEDEATLKSVLDSQQKIHGADTFSIGIENFDGATLLAHLVLHEATYLIFGDEMTVRQALDGHTQALPESGPGIRASLSSEAASWAAAELSPSVMQSLLSVKTGNPFIDGPLQHLNKLKAIGLSGNVEETFQLEMQMAFEDADAASKISATLNGLIGVLRLSAMKTQNAMPPFLNTLSIDQNAETLAATLEFTFDDVLYTEKSNP